MSVILAFVIIGIVTYIMRATVVLGQGWFVNETWIEERIVYVAPAVLAALVASALFTQGGTFSFGNTAEIAAVFVAIITVRRTGNPAMALVTGLPTYWLLSAAAMI